jgi:primosomal protein N' (replication factor Y)
MKLAEVAVNFPQKKTLDLLTYLIPADREVSPGDIVTVPLGKRKEIACVVKLISEKELKFDIKKIKPIEDFEDEVLRLSSKELALYQWVSSYYHYPLGKLIFDCLPNIHSVKPPKFSKLKKINFPFALDGIIKQYYDQILENSNQFSQWLVHGVTGSGKSILFYFLIKKILSEGKSVLLLVPEINLTPQFLNFYGQYLDETVYPYHSAVSSAKKFQIWMDAKTNDGPKLIIGARSSIFMPVKNLGAIFIDEEHDHSFKQDDRCHFHARSVAIKKAQLENIPVVLASATPSLETYTRFIADKKNYLPMKERFNNSKLPEVVKIKNPEYTDSSWPISPGDIELIKNNPADKFIFFVNKLGYSNYLLCRACGHKFECPNCSVSLTNYEKSNILSCHLCEYKIKRPNMCPECSCLDLSPVGFGTEKLEKVLTEYFPEKKILRFDRDEIKNQTQLVARLDEIYSGQFDILVGTQMIAKVTTSKASSLFQSWELMPPCQFQILDLVNASINWPLKLLVELEDLVKKQ